MTNYEKLLMLPALKIHLNDPHLEPALVDPKTSTIYTYQSPAGIFTRQFFPVSKVIGYTVENFNALPDLSFASVKVVFPLSELVRGNSNQAYVKIEDAEALGLTDNNFNVFNSDGSFSNEAIELKLTTLLRASTVFMEGLTYKVLEDPFEF